MEDAGGGATPRIAKGFLTAGCAGIEFGALTNYDATGLTVGRAATIQ